MTRTALLSYNQISWYKICCMTVSGSETGRISPEILQKQEAKGMKQLNMKGKACPMPVIETKKILEEVKKAEEVRVLVDNEIAVQNLTKLAGHEGMKAVSEKHSDKEFEVTFLPSESRADGPNVPHAGRAGEWGRQRKSGCHRFRPDGRAGGGAWKNSYYRIYLCSKPPGASS